MADSLILDITMTRAFKLISFFLICLCAIQAAASDSWVTFRHIGLSSGLSHTTVPSITQDSVGYIWMATHDGLNRFDGYSFRIYRHAADETRSLADNVVRQVEVDSVGTLWIVTGRALSRYDRQADRFDNYTVDGKKDVEFNFVLPIDSSTLAVATSAGIYAFDIAAGSFSPVAMSDAGISSLARMGDTLYAGTSRGLYRYDRATGEMVPVDGATGMPVNALYADRNNRLWIGTEGHGLLVHDCVRRTTATADARLSRFVRSLDMDASGRLWVGTFEGLYVYDVARGDVRAFKASGHRADGRLSQSSVRSIFADRDGGVWLGTYFGGVNYYHPLQNRFRNIAENPGQNSLNDNVISCIVRGSDGLIYIGTNAGGLNIFNPADGSYRHITPAEGLRSNDVKAVYVDSAANRIYIGSHLGGLSVFDLRNLRHIETHARPTDVYAIAPAQGGGLWLGTLDGLYRYDTASGKISAVDKDASGRPIPVNKITDIYRDLDGYLWLSGERGLAVYDSRLAQPSDRDLAYCQELEIAYINNVYQSPTRRDYWISTRDGLYMLSPDFKEVKRFAVADGLPNDIVYGVLEDYNGDMWMSTNNGLSKYDRTTREFHNYSERDYLTHNQFNPKAFALMPDGRMYFGGVNGLVTFMPSEIERNPTSPRPVITGVRLFGKPLEPGDESGVLKKTMECARQIILKPDQSMITIDFTVCNYSSGEHNTYAYRLEGYDDEWFDSGEVRSATYRNLPPGKYVFQVRAANNDGVWSPVRSLIVRVLPHWYQTWLARLLFALFIVGAVFVLFRYFTQRRLREQQQEYDRRDAERRQEINDMKVNFFVNMSHELRTPLTLILLPVTELIEQKRNDPKVFGKLETIRRNTLRILNIINQILDYQRAENGMFRLKVSPMDLNAFITDELSIYRQAAAHKNISCSFDSTIADRLVPLDASYLSIIIGNLLSNAFKHTPAGGEVKVAASFDDTSERLVIRISDTGEGIGADKLAHIFDRFYKVDENSYGSGIGLSLVKRLVDLHHGSITVSSRPGMGTEFTILLPALESAYSEDERDSTRQSCPSDTREVYVPDDYTAAEPDSRDADAQAADRATILLVDDNETILKYMSDALAPSYNVLTAENGTKALDVLSSANIDMVITDVMMPETDGIQLCRSIKRNLRTSHIPVMMLSAKSDVKDQLDAMKVGADDYLPKPFSMPLLLGKIANRFRTRARAIKYYANTTDVEPARMGMNPLDEEFLNNAIKTVEAHMDDSEFTTDGFAREMLMSRSNLHLKLKALTGESANEFIRRIRMNKALELLKSGRYNVAEVSSMVGYGTPSYFSTSFKKFFGGLPSEYTKF